jgi:hypothetical protein
MTFKEWWKTFCWEEELMNGGKKFYYMAYRAGQAEMRERAAEDAYDPYDAEEYRKNILSLPDGGNR